MNGKEKFKEMEIIEDMEIPEEEGNSSEKATAKHVENKVPYWDTPYVIGASRNLQSSSSISRDNAKRPGCIRRLWLHYKRYWILYTILAVLALAAGLPILFLVIFPAIAQRIVDNAKLPIHSASIMSPTPNSVVYSLSASIKVPPGITVDLKPMNLSLYTPTTGPTDPYIKVSLPEYHLRGDDTVSIVNQTAEILDVVQFDTFLKEAVDTKTFTLDAYGTTTAYLGILKAPLTLNKQVTMTGLSNISGFEFANAAIVFPPEPDGTNLEGTVILPNPSIVTFELGNVTVNMIVGGIIIGEGRINNIVLVPGNNTVPIRATVNLKTCIENLSTLLASEAKALTSGNVVISASGNSTIFNGQHIPYYENVLNNLVLTGEMPLIQIILDSLENLLGGTGNNTILNSIIGAFSGNGTGTNLLTTILNGLGNIGNSSSLLGELKM